MTKDKLGLGEGTIMALSDGRLEKVVQGLDFSKVWLKGNSPVNMLEVVFLGKLPMSKLKEFIAGGCKKTKGRPKNESKDTTQG